MRRADLRTSPAGRLGVAVLVAAIHLAAAVLLARAFAPDLTATVADRVGAALTVTVTTPPPLPPEPKPKPKPKPAAAERAGAAGAAGRKATPREVVAPVPRIVLATRAAPRVASTGRADSAGAREQGAGTGAGGVGQGLGAGGAGNGTGAGGGAATRPVKIAGDINSARDYPAKTRELRLGDHVIVALRVGTDGRARSCRVVRASRDAEADRITCRLAVERFRFRPARDAVGRPVESEFGWRQRWFRPRQGDTAAQHLELNPESGIIEAQ